MHVYVMIQHNTYVRTHMDIYLMHISIYVLVHMLGSMPHIEQRNEKKTLTWPFFSERPYPHVKDMTASLTWESPYLGKTVFILRRGPDHLILWFMLTNIALILYLSRRDIIRIIQSTYALWIWYKWRIFIREYTSLGHLYMHIYVIIQLDTNVHTCAYVHPTNNGCWYV